MTKYGRPCLVGAGVVDLGDVRVVHQREGLPLRLEAGQHRLRVHAGLDQLDGHQPLDRLPLLRHPDGAHAAVADLFQQLVPPSDDRADRLGIGRGRLPPARRAWTAGRSSG